jgi:hypothetical protein
MTDTTKTIDATTSTDTMSLTLTFSNGETIVLTTAQISTDIANQAMLHGLKQKLVDAAAISRNPDTGRSATVDDKYNAVREVYDRLLSGQWNKSRGEGSSTSGGLLFRALCQMYADKTPDAIKAFLDKKTPTEKAALRATPKIAAIIETIRAEKASDIDTDDMLAELG